MQEHVKVSNTDLIVNSSPSKVTVRSSTSTGLFVKRIKLVPRMLHREMWCSGYFRNILPLLLRMLNPSSPTSTVTRSMEPFSSTKRTLKRSPGMINSFKLRKQGQLPHCLLGYRG